MAADGIIMPIAALIDRIVPDAAARDAAKLELLRLDRAHELDRVKADLIAQLGVGEASSDPWIARARPSFLYVIYALLLWSIPTGLIAVLRPAWAAAIAQGMSACLNAIPEPLYALFGTGYLGYTVAREWGKGRGR